MKVASIRFPARWCLSDGNACIERIEKTEFKLGPGRCGKEVTYLEAHFYPGLFRILQVCSDGSRKTFSYRMEDICGRVEWEEVPA